MGFKSFLRFGIEFTVVALIITFLPGLPPNNNFLKPYQLAKFKPLEGTLEPNTKLTALEILFKGDIKGAESFAEYKGVIYSGLETGEIVKIVGKHIVPVAKIGKACKGLYQQKICGRPLGMRFTPNGELIVSDAYYGIFKVDVNTGDTVKIIGAGEEINGKKVKLPNSLAIACNGDIYWTESSTEFSLEDILFDVLSDASGRLIHYDAKTKTNKVLIDNLHFANGLALSKNEDFLIVAETIRNRIHRYYLKGAKKGTHDIFVDGLPGMPDNVQSDGSSGFLVTLVSEGNKENPSAVHLFRQFPNVRKFFVRILGLIELGFKGINRVYPNEISEMAIHMVGNSDLITQFTNGRSIVLHLSEKGEILDSLFTDTTTTRFCEALIHKDQLMLASPWNDFIARTPLSKIGWSHLKQNEDLATIKKKWCSAGTEAPRVVKEAPKPTQPPKVVTEAPKTTPPPKVVKEAPKETVKPTPKPTVAPKVVTEAPKVKETVKPTPKPTVAPKVVTEAPKVVTQNAKPTAAPKVVKEVPKATRPVKNEKIVESPKVDAPKPSAVPKVEVKAEKPVPSQKQEPKKTQGSKNVKNEL